MFKFQNIIINVHIFSPKKLIKFNKYIIRLLGFLSFKRLVKFSSQFIKTIINILIVTFNSETVFSVFLCSFKDCNKTIIACSFFCNNELCAIYLVCFSIHYKKYHLSTLVGLFLLEYLTTLCYNNKFVTIHPLYPTINLKTQENKNLILRINKVRHQDVQYVTRKCTGLNIAPII